jgi:hypothetical protein
MRAAMQDEDRSSRRHGDRCDLNEIPRTGGNAGCAVWGCRPLDELVLQGRRISGGTAATLTAKDRLADRDADNEDGE